VKLEEYLKIRRALKSPKDFDKFGRKNYILSSILNQKTVDRVLRTYHQYNSDLNVIARIWKEKRRIPVKLPPVLRVRLLLKSLGFSKSEIQNALKYPDELEDDLSNVVWNAITSDFIYSPIAVKFQSIKGYIGEKLVATWLEDLDVDFLREEDLRRSGGKTPDFYIKNPIEIQGLNVRWIESKFMFGDLRVHSFYWRKQYYRYFKDFGKGLIIYWSEHLEDLPFSTSGKTICDLNMTVEFRFCRLSRERFIKTLENVLERFKRGERIVVRGNNRLQFFLKGLGFDVVLSKDV
jgi:hypothetical protein